MDTAKVDIRKLQQLNDRINQCFEALNQVRGSVHGLSHSNPQAVAAWPQQPFNVYGMQDPRFQAQHLGSGLSHSPYSPQIGPYGIPLAAGPVAYATPQNLYPQQPIGFAATQGWIPSGGLSHSTADQGPWPSLSNDPGLAYRIVQTFPNVQQTAPPVTSIP